MAKIKKIYKKINRTEKELVYPTTITQAIKDGVTGETLPDILTRINDYEDPSFRFKASETQGQGETVGTIQVTHDQGASWEDVSPEFTNNLRIKGYVATTSALPSGQAVGTIYGVGPTYDASDTGQTNPIYTLYVYNGTSWVNNGCFTSIAAGVVQETGDSETEVMSQKAVTEELSQLGLKTGVTELQTSTASGTFIEFPITEGNTYIIEVDHIESGVYYQFTTDGSASGTVQKFYINSLRTEVVATVSVNYLRVGTTQSVQQVRIFDKGSVQGQVATIEGRVDTIKGQVIGLVGILQNSSYYEKEWNLDDVWFNALTGKLRKCVALSGSTPTFEDVPFLDGALYTSNGVVWRHNGEGLCPIGGIIELMSITDTSPLTDIGQFYYSQSYRQIGILTTSVGGNIASYKIPDGTNALYLWEDKLWRISPEGELICIEQGEDKSPINALTLSYIGSAGNDYTQWEVGDIMYNIKSGYLRKCISTDGAGTGQTLEDFSVGEDCFFRYKGHLYINDNTATSGIRLISSIVTLKSITNSSPLTELGQLYYSSTNKDIRIKVNDTGAYHIEVSDNCLYEYENSLYKLIDGELYKVVGASDEEEEEEMGNPFSIELETIEVPSDINEFSDSRLMLIATKKDNYYCYHNEPIETPQDRGYLYSDENTNKLYYSANVYNKPEFLCDWNTGLADGMPLSKWFPIITKDGDIIFVPQGKTIRANPIVYPHTDYNSPIKIDLGLEWALGGMTSDNNACSFCYGDFILFGEYINGATSVNDSPVRLWKVSAPYTSKDNWKIVHEYKHISSGTTGLTEETAAGYVSHFHTVAYDHYSGVFYANTGDPDPCCRVLKSLDLGENWTEIASGSQDYRTLGYIFTKDACYWGTDSSGSAHALYKAERDATGEVDFSTYHKICNLWEETDNGQRVYCTCETRTPHGLLFLERAEPRTDGKFTVPFWSFDYEKLFLIEGLEPLKDGSIESGGDSNGGDSANRYGFGNHAHTYYQSTQEDGIICGASSWSRTMSLDVLNNSSSNRLGVVKIKILHGGVTSILSETQAESLGDWKNFNVSSLTPKVHNKKSLSIISKSSWYAETDMGSVEESDTDVYDEIAGDYVQARKCISNNTATSTDGARFIAKLDTPMDMTYNVLRGAIYQDLDFQIENLGNMSVSLYSDNSINSSHRAYFVINFGYNNNAAYVRSGWHHFCVNIPLMGEKGASFDAANVTHVSFNVNHAAGSTLECAVTQWDIVPNMIKPGIVTIIDNFNPNVPAMADYAASKGIKLNLSIVPNWIGDNSKHGTLQQIYDAANQGHFIFNHTWNHQIYGGQTDIEVFEQIDKANRWMVEHGFIRGAKVLSVPSAAFDNQKYQAFLGSEAAMIFHHWTPLQLVQIPQTRADGSTRCILYYPYKGMQRLLNISALDSYYTEDQSIAESAILGANAAIQYGGILVFGFHGYGTEYGGYMTDDTEWKAYIDAISQLSIHHYTIDELVEGCFM